MEQEKTVGKSDIQNEEENDLQGAMETRDTNVENTLELSTDTCSTKAKNSQKFKLDSLENVDFLEYRKAGIEMGGDTSETLSNEEALLSNDKDTAMPYEKDFDGITTAQPNSLIPLNCSNTTLTSSSYPSDKTEDVMGSDYAYGENIENGDLPKEISEDRCSTGKESLACNDAQDEHSSSVVNASTGSTSDVEEDMAWPSEDFHMYMLGKVCRICGERTIYFDGPKKGFPKDEVVRYVKKIWGVDISDEDSSRYPVNVCLACERKIKRLYKKVSKKKKCEMFRTSPAEFEPHRDLDCPVCLLKNASVETQNQNANVETQNQSHAVKKEKSSTEVRKNPARKRGWPNHGPLEEHIGCKDGIEASFDATHSLEEHDYVQDESGVVDEYPVLPKKRFGKAYKKQPLSSVNCKYIKQDRLKPLISHIDKFCLLHKENKVEVMFFMLMQALRDAGDRKRETAIIDIWTKKGSEGTSLTEEECLAKRVLLKQTKDQYRKEYSYYREKLEKPVLKPPFIIDKLEKTYFPEHLDYYITDEINGPVIYNHEKMNNPSYFALQESVDNGSKGDGVMGIRWRYFDAVAKTLEEFTHTLQSDMQDLGENSCIQVDLSDYCEEKKDVTHSSEKNDAANSKRFQSKMITYLFCVQSLQAVTGDVCHWTYDRDICRPLMKALVSDASALRSSMLTIKEERDKMTRKYFHIVGPNGTPFCFMVYFSNEAPEVRRDYRNITGLSLSSFKKVPSVINRYGNLCLELKRNWLASSPRLSHVGRITNFRTKCSRCGEQGHNVRKCPKSSSDNVDGNNVVPRKKQKKLRSIPPNAYPSSITDRTQPTQVAALSQQEEQQHHQMQPHSVQQLKKDHEGSLAPLTLVPSNINHSNPVVQNEEQLLWACSGVENNSRIDTQHSQNTQVLIPTSNSEYQVLPQRTLIQGSQGASPPVCVWTYTVVQPQPGSVIQHQPVNHHLTELHQPSNQQQMNVIQPAPSHQLQQLSTIHQEPSQVTMSVGHPHDNRADQTVQQLGIIQQPTESLHSIDTPQHMTQGHQGATSQPQSHQQIIAHQQVTQTVVQQVSQSVVQQASQPQLRHSSETSSPHEQLSHPQNSNLQPVIGQW